MDLFLILIILFLIVSYVAYYLWDQNTKFKRILRRYRARYSKIIDIDEEAERLKAKSIRLKSSFKVLSERHSQLQIEVGDLEEASEMAEYGMYKPIYDLKDSIRYKKEISKIRDEQSKMIKSKYAILDSWGSKKTKEEKKILEKISKISLTAYNVECDNLILKVNYKNIKIIEQRMDRLLEKMNKQLGVIEMSINQSFHDIKKEELYLVHEYHETLQKEKEEQKRIKEQMREEAEDQRRAEQEIKKVEEEAKKEEELYQKLIDEEKQKLEQGMSEEKEAMLLRIQNLERSLEEAHSKKERALSMAQQTKRGHVYIISNIGSFGPNNNVYKIGMTRRLEPLDRVKELGDSSVPFSFDIHAMIYSDNAPSLEKEFHNYFEEKRVNKINTRKEFFSVPLFEIQKFCEQKGLHIQLTQKAEATEYYQTLQMISDTQKEEGVVKNINSEQQSHLSIDDIDFGDDLDDDDVA